MPIIPVSPQGISMDVPGASVNPANAALVQESVAGLGAALAKSADKIDEQMHHAEAVDASEKAYLQDQIDSQDQFHALTISNPDGYIRDASGQVAKNADGSARTITHAFRDWANDRFRANQEAMPSALAQQMYAQKAERAFTERTIEVRNEEWKQRIESYRRGFDDSARLMENRITDTPSVLATYSALDELRPRLLEQQGKIFSPQQVYDRDKLLLDTIPGSLFRGLYNQALAEPKNGENRTDRIAFALSVLRGQDADSIRRKQAGLKTLSELMDPHKKAQFEEEFIRLIPTARSADLSSTNAMVRDIVGNLKTGDLSVPIDPSFVIGRVMSEVAAGHRDPYDGAVKVGEMLAWDRGVKVVNDPVFLLSNDQQRAQAIEKAAKDVVASFQSQLSPEMRKALPAVGGEVYHQVVTSMQERAKAAQSDIKQDFAAAVIKYDPSVRNVYPSIPWNAPQELPKASKQINAIIGSAERWAGMSHLNPADFRPIPKDASEKMAQAITNDQTGYTQSTQMLNGIRAASKKYYGQIVETMIQDGKLPAIYRLFPLTNDAQANLDLMRTVRDGDKIRANAAKALEGYNIAEIDVDTQVAKKIAPFVTDFYLRNPESPINTQYIELINRTIGTKAREIIVASGGDTKPADAAQQAFQALISNRFHKMTVGGGWFTGPGTKSEVHLPAADQGIPFSPDERDYLKRNMENLLDSEVVSKNRLVAPPLPNGQPAPFQDKFAEQVARTGKVVPGAHGVTIQYFSDHSKSYVTAFQEQGGGRPPIPFFVPYSELRKPAPKTFMEKVMDKIPSLPNLSIPSDTHEPKRPIVPGRR